MVRNPGPGTLQGGAVRLTLSAKVANNLGALQKGLAQLAERLGHSGCASGCDILHFGLEREFTISSAVELNPQPLPPSGDMLSLDSRSVQLPQDPVPCRPVSVSMPPAVLGNIDSLNSVIATVLGKLGCGACCSGFDIAFQREIDHFAVDSKLNVQGFGSFR